MDMEKLILSKVVSRSLRKKNFWQNAFSRSLNFSRLLSQSLAEGGGGEIQASSAGNGDETNIVLVRKYTLIIAILFPFCYAFDDPNVNAFHVFFVFMSNC